MKTYFLILISLFFVGNQHINKKSENKKSISNQFFEFDEIEHYQVNITNGEFLNLIAKKNQTLDETKFLEILTDDYPKSINDINFMKNLEKSYPKKKKIEKIKFKAIANIYSEKIHKNPIYASCAPLYRDILVFKKNNVITGISKICFHCYIQRTIGSKKNTDNIGQSGDMRKLEQILN